MLGAACDQGAQHDQSPYGPHLHVVGANVGPDRPLPADGVLQIAFDRLLLPLTVSRQSFVLRDASGNLVTSPLVSYDPVARLVTIANPNAGPEGWLRAGLFYRLDIGIPKGDDDGSGPRAIDRATLDPAEGPVVLGFAAAPATGGAPGPSGIASVLDPPIAFCRDVLPIFQRKCSASQCHGAPVDGSAPAAGLILQTPDGIRRTALGRVAQGSNTGGRAGGGSPPGRRFGIDMPIVDASGTFGDPGNSWLLYKVLLGRPRPVDRALDGGEATCAGAPPIGIPWSTLAQPLSDDERARLADWVLGREMPYPLNLTEDTPTPSDMTDTLPLDLQELERVRAWIAQGASVPDCAACTP